MPARPDDGLPSGEHVHVVIPTTGRPSLLRAVESVLAQTAPIHRVIVSIDGPADLVTDLPDDPRVVVTASGEQLGANSARDAGMALVHCGLVALLDDDDVWAPQKIELQLEAYREAVRGGAEHVVVACRAWYVDPAGVSLDIAPGRLLCRDESMASYLFDRTTIRGTDAAIGSSMLLFDHALVAAIPFDTTLTRHTDWDWLVRVDASGTAEFVMLPDLLIGYTVNTFGASASSAGNWRNSEEWVRLRADLLTPRQQSEVLLSVTAPLAMQRGEWRATAKVMAEAARLDPSYRSWLFSLSHVPVVAARRAAARLQRR